MSCWLVSQSLPCSLTGAGGVGGGPGVIPVPVWTDAGNTGLHVLAAVLTRRLPIPCCVPAGQEFLLSSLPWPWLSEAVASRCSSSAVLEGSPGWWTPQLGTVPANGQWLDALDERCSCFLQLLLTEGSAPANFSCCFLKLQLCPAAPAPAQLWWEMLLLLSSGDFSSSYWTLQLPIALASFQLKVISGPACWNSSFLVAVVASYNSS